MMIDIRNLLLVLVPAVAAAGCSDGWSGGFDSGTTDADTDTDTDTDTDLEPPWICDTIIRCVRGS